MFLTASNLVHYLSARGIVSTASVVDGDFSVVEAGRRNRNYKVFRKHEPGLFIKQAKSADPMETSTLQREAACYDLAQQDSVFRHLAELMPPFIAYDPGRHILIVELLPSSENLYEYQARRNGLPAETGRLLGERLGRYHATLNGNALRDMDMTQFPRLPPWILSFHRSVDRMKTLSGGNMQLSRIILEHPDLYESIDRLRNGWCYDCIIHGDIKWENCMLYGEGEEERQLKIIDWELVDYGDAAWDVGGVLQAYLTSWIFSMPFSTESDPRKLVGKASRKLENLFPSIRAFWTSYCNARGIAPMHAPSYLLRCIEYGAARLLQTAFEYLHYAQAMTDQGAILLQVSQNILRNPYEAADELFGLSARQS